MQGLASVTHGLTLDQVRPLRHLQCSSKCVVSWLPGQATWACCAIAGQQDANMHLPYRSLHTQHIPPSHLQEVLPLKSRWYAEQDPYSAGCLIPYELAPAHQA